MNAFDKLAAAGHPVGIGIQILDIIQDLTDALEAHHYDPTDAQHHEGLQDRWTNAAPETRAAILLGNAWLAREHILKPTNDTAGLYAIDLHTYAHKHKGTSEDFHGEKFPSMPLPGKAGALASSLAFDRDDVAISLKSALQLLAAGAPPTDPHTDPAA